MVDPSVERVNGNEPPAFPVLQTTILPVAASGAGVAVTAPTAKPVVGTNAGDALGSIGESEHAARNATPSPAPAISATCLFIRILSESPVCSDRTAPAGRNHILPSRRMTVTRSASILI